jgi:uncharacterized protein (TIGR00730 family)
MSTSPSINDPPILDRIEELITLMNGRIDSYEGDLILQLIQTALRLLQDKADLGELKLILRSLKEMRYSFKAFREFPAERRVSIFGSARTKPDHADYQEALLFSRLMSEKGWSCMTGAADGIMKAGLEGAHPTNRFGLSIRLPWETGANVFIENDPKHIMFRYFFTRKLMFVSQADAFAAFPGGFGTMDELFEVLTLMQTGRSEIVPIVLMEGKESPFWSHWQSFVKESLLRPRWISEEDLGLFFYAKRAEEAVDHILKFYSNYHSSRYVKELFVVRMKKAPSESQLREINKRFEDILAKGTFILADPFPEEKDHLDLPRLAFHHNRKHYAHLRKLIDYLNEI